MGQLHNTGPYPSDNDHFYTGESKFLILGHVLGYWMNSVWCFGIIVLPSKMHPGKFFRVGIFRGFSNCTDGEAVDITII